MLGNKSQQPKLPVCLIPMALAFLPPVFSLLPQILAHKQQLWIDSPQKSQAHVVPGEYCNTIIYSNFCTRVTSFHSQNKTIRMYTTSRRTIFFSNKATTWSCNSHTHTHTHTPLFFSRWQNSLQIRSWIFHISLKIKKSETHLPSFILPKLTSVKWTKSSLLFIHPLKWKNSTQGYSHW